MFLIKWKNEDGSKLQLPVSDACGEKAYNRVWIKWALWSEFSQITENKIIYFIFSNVIHGI